MNFRGSKEEIISKCGDLGKEGNWREVTAEQLQFRHKSGAIMNWSSTTGKINFQGAHNKIPFLQQRLKEAFDVNDAVKSSASIANGTATSSSMPSAPATLISSALADNYRLDIDSELVIGLVTAVGTDLDYVVRILKERLATFEYEAREIKISSDVIATFGNVSSADNFQRIDGLMTEGNRIRKQAEDKSILAKAAAAKISEIRARANNGEEAPLKRNAFIISSLKQPAEVQALRKIYSSGFFLIGVYASEQRRSEYLNKDKDISLDNVAKLIKRDVDESDPYGQHTRDTYHLSDFFINYDGNHDKFKNDLWRTLDLIFGKPFVTPTFDEFAMFMAFSSSLRSADLSRQVGAVVAKNGTIVATGANDVPRAGGGQYWPQYDGHEIKDAAQGRDYMLGQDPNATERKSIVDEIVLRMPEDQQEEVRAILDASKLKNITEYGRVVHAEMEALLSCSRENIGTRHVDLYCTTFPCHNCAKHIIAAGVKRVVYVEPYPKSKALDFHGDAITLDASAPQNKVVFEPFVGVGPRSFFNLFSTGLGSGYEVVRKSSDGKIVKWDEHGSKLRMQMLPTSYIERETSVADEFNQKLEKINGK
jgi:deoxycytidylate deaminase